MTAPDQMKAHAMVERLLAECSRWDVLVATRTGSGPPWDAAPACPLARRLRRRKFAGIVRAGVRSLASTDNNRQEASHD